VFRDDELGRWHQPEFTLLEWYRVGWDELELMTEVEALLRAALARGAAPADRGAPPAWRAARMRYAEAFDRCLGFDLADDTAALVERLRARGIDVPAGLDRDATLDLALSTAIVPQLERGALTFIHDFPPSQAALARIKPGPPPVAARFEAFAGGIELANGFAELTDAAEQRRRFEADLEARRRAGRGMPPLDEDFLAALARGLPECAGVAVGLDRLVALACGLDDVAGAVSFAHVPPRA
jgi:lysyl-tRNA synthetase class 2